MSSKADEYRRRAAEAEQRSKDVRDYQARQAYEEVARYWREMAEQAERFGW